MEFTFVLPKKIIFGWDLLDRLPQVLGEIGGKSPCVITSRGMVKRDGFLKTANLIGEKGLVTVFKEVEPEPAMETVERCLEFVKESTSDSVIGLGGGSVMDVAKKVALESNLPKIMIPTTAGTGSEVTHESVLKVEGKKRAFVDERLVADVAIVDPSLMMSMPPRLAASSGLDALAHAVESYQCKRGNELTKALAWNAYSIIRENIRKAVAHDAAAVSNMALASLMAGMAFGNSGTTLGHALAYPLSNRGVPHGEAVAIVLPFALEFNDFDEKAVIEIRQMIQDVGLPTSFKGDASEMARDVMEDERHLSNNPKPVAFEDVVRIYRRMEGMRK